MTAQIDIAKKPGAAAGIASRMAERSISLESSTKPAAASSRWTVATESPIEPRATKPSTAGTSPVSSRMTHFPPIA